ncbi:MAG TPA: EamA family transporter [Gaiellaceae bacterium]|nr:EamA family transporter [Gaiellaceae bacterium]
MPLDALALALGAAGLHAAWNLLLARERDTEAALAVGLLALVATIALPAALTWRVDSAAVPYIVGSTALELVYVALLAAAYRRYELSLVYPVARGLAPVLALLFAAAVGAALPSRLGVAGVTVVAAGVLLVRGARGSLHGLALGAVIAAAIAGYTVVDRYGIRHAAAAPYLLLVMLGPALAYPLTVGLGRVRAAVSQTAFAVGAAAAAAYLLVLLALRLASAPAVAAVRETSVVIAIVLAAVFLHERVTPLRAAGAVLVAAGVALLAFS